MSSKKLLSDNGYTVDIKKENTDRDFLFRTNTYQLFNNAKQCVASFQTVPFPKCCGVRVWQNTSVGHNMRFEEGKTKYDCIPYEIFEAFLSVAWEDDQRQNKPGLYMATIVIHTSQADKIYDNYKYFDRFFTQHAIQISETRNPIYTAHSIRTYSFVHPALKEDVVKKAGEKQVIWHSFNSSFDLLDKEAVHA